MNERMNKCGVKLICDMTEAEKFETFLYLSDKLLPIEINSKYGVVMVVPEHMEEMSNLRLMILGELVKKYEIRDQHPQTIIKKFAEVCPEEYAIWKMKGKNE